MKITFDDDREDIKMKEEPKKVEKKAPKKEAPKKIEKKKNFGYRFGQKSNTGILAT